MDIPLSELISGGGTLALAMVVWWELRGMRQVLEQMIERLARIDVRTAELDSPQQQIDEGRRRRTRTPVATPFMDPDQRGDR